MKMSMLKIKTKMEKGFGIYIYDSSGKEYIDCGSGTFNLSLGYNHPQVMEAVKSQMEKAVHISSTYSNSLFEKLESLLLSTLPNKIKHINFKNCSGSMANEGAIKMARYSNSKIDIVSLFRSHHGQGIFSMGISGNSFRQKGFNLTPNNILKIPAPYCKRCFYGLERHNCDVQCATRLEDFIEFSSSGEISAIIIEPVLGNGDNIVYPKEFLIIIREICKKRNICLIFDEIQTGVGRTGHMYASDYFGVTPDIMTLGKGVSGCGFPMAIIASTDEYSTMPQDNHKFIFGGNLLSIAATIKTLEIVQQATFLDNVNQVGSYIMSRLSVLKHNNPYVFDIRGIGLMIGIEIIDLDNKPSNQITNNMAELAFKKGLILRTSRYGHGNVLKIRPPLITTMQEAKRICELFESTLVEYVNNN